MLYERLIYIYKESKSQNPSQKKKYYKLTNEGKEIALLYLGIDNIYNGL